MSNSASDNGTAIFLIAICVLAVVTTIQRWWNAWRDDRLLKNNPAAWKARKEVEETAKQNRNQTIGKAAGVGVQIARMFLGK